MSKRKPKKVVNLGGRPPKERKWPEVVGVHFTHTSAKVPKGCRFECIDQGVWPMWRVKLPSGQFHVEKRQQGLWRSRCQDCGKMHGQRSIHKRPHGLDKFPFSVFCDKCRTGKRGVTVLFRAYNQVPEAAEPMILDADFNPVGVMPEDADAPISADDRAVAERVISALIEDTPENRYRADGYEPSLWGNGVKMAVKAMIDSTQCAYIPQKFILELAKNG